MTAGESREKAVEANVELVTISRRTGLRIIPWRAIGGSIVHESQLSAHHVGGAVVKICGGST